jgi:hypothetical protein|tara:strand:- start:158 stop:805 length:648 start_codon:yes stop_codon:yes gene_type:complete
MADFGGPGSGYGSAQDTFDSAAGRGGSRTGSGGGAGPSRSDTGTGTDEVYQSFVEASQPRGLSAIERAVQNTVQKTKNYLSNPVNQRGIIGSLLGGLLLGPFGAFLGGSLGQRYGGSIKNAFSGPQTNTDDTEIDMLTRAGILKAIPNVTMPQTKPTNVGITQVDFPLYAQRPTSGYEDPDRAKEKDDALEEFYKENPEFRPPEQSGINQLQFIV